MQKNQYGLFQIHVISYQRSSKGINFPVCFYREHLIRLQHENKMLKLAQEGSDNEKIALLQSLLEDANRRKNELETENR